MTPPSLTSSILFRIENATILRPAGETIFEGLSWTIREGETWAIVGGVGSGKSSLTEVLLGRHSSRLTPCADSPLDEGRQSSNSNSLHTECADYDEPIQWPLIDRLRATGHTINWPAEIIGRVAFKEESRLFSYSRHYYQQRFNFIEPDDDLTLDQYLRAGTTGTDEELIRITTRLGIEQLRPLSFIKLSNGQTRRARIAKVLLSRPEILVLDEPLVGLDTQGRREVTAILQQLVAEGSRLILILPADAIPDCVTHVLELTDRRVSYSGRREDYVVGTLHVPSPNNTRSVPTTHETPIIELKNVSVLYSGKPILRDISWTVLAGERWAILGPNGSGKTTLLSLICGDHPQAYSNHVRLFGRQRGDGESMWEIKRRIGFFSPELHLYFSEPLTADRTAATGFSDVLVPRRTTTEQDVTVRELFDYFEIGHLREHHFFRLSTGQQRIVLLIRALVKNPPLFVLDEPFQVLDARTKELARKWIDERISPEQTVLFITHDERELPRTVTLRLQLDRGQVA